MIRPGEPGWETVDRHLDQLLDLSEGDAEDYLSRLEVTHPELTATLRELLKTRREVQASGFLEASPLASDEERAGTQVGAYTITALIGRGGMGEVWLAQRSDGRFEGQFAVKFLDSYAASPAAIERFRREGRLLARLTHPHIARLIDAGVTDSARPYLILEYVPGERIDRYCDSHALTVPERIRLLIEVLAALAHAHNNLIVHRDIKPSNILVSAGGQPKLLDFGIAKLLAADSGSAEESPPTRAEDAAFTPEFAAPEQILGEPASTATDVYQVGVLLFVLLAGQLPVPSGHATRAERIKKALDGEAPRLSEVAPPELRRALRGDLDAIASKALRKLPHERYPTAAALAEDLRRYLENEPVTARANLIGYRVRKFVRRYKGAVLGTAAAVAALVATTAFAVYQMREAQAQRDQLAEQARRAEMQAELVTLMTSTVGSRPTTAEQLIDEGVRLLSEHYTDDPRFRVSALLNLSARYGDLGLTQKQHALLTSANEIAYKLNDSALIARSECGLAEAEIDLGHLDRALALVADGRERLARVVNAGPLYVEDCMEAAADVSDAQGNPRAATQIAEQALALLEQAHATHDVRYPDLLGRIADYYKAAGMTHQGFEYTERALSAEQLNGLGDTDSAMTAMHNVASSLVGFGEVQEACTREKDLIARLQASGRSVITAMAVLYGSCLLRTGQPAQALTWYDRGVASAQTENDAALQMYARANRARALIALGRFPEALAELERVDSLARDHDLAGGLQASRAQIVRAELLLAQGHADEARRALQPPLQLARDSKSGQGLLLPSALLWAARAALAQGRYAEGAALAAEAVRADEQRARNPAASADVGEASLLLARCRRALHDDAGAEAAANRALISLSASLGPDSALTREARSLQ